jgi:hypothetical protein
MDTSINGFLFITDITGYTAYLNHSELEHAQDSLKSILDILIEQTKLPLLISRLEGDAIISYAPQNGFLQGQTLVDMVEKTYISFRRALELMVLNTTCTCRACGNLPNLDLKFFVHFGTFALHELPTYTELIGNDVNTIHRLTKNTITEKIGLKAYVLFTQAAIDALDLPELVNELEPHSEEYEHIVEVQSYIGNMHPLWEQEKGKRRLAVEQEKALFTLEFDIPIEPARFWDYLTLPENYAIITGANSIKHQNLKNGRVQQGSLMICAHGKSVTRFTFVDWQPFDQFTISNPIYKGTSTKTTYRLLSTNTGTKLLYLAGKIEGGVPLINTFIHFIFKKMFPKNFRGSMNSLIDKIQQGKNSGEILDLIPIQITLESINTAVKDSLNT